MTNYFAENGEIIPVTVVKANPVTITQVKTKDGKDKYNAVQVGVKSSIGGKSKLDKPSLGRLKDLGKYGMHAEFKPENIADYEVGKELTVAQFNIGDLVNCKGIMKGRGFTGAIKRHGFAGFPASHGHNRPRSVGSIGQRFPQHTRKGLRMSGHMGTTQVTVKNLQIVAVDEHKGLLMIKGALPGSRNGTVRLISTGVNKPIITLEKIDPKKKK